MALVKHDKAGYVLFQAQTWISRSSNMPVSLVLTSPGPSQNPVGLQQPPGYSMSHQPTYNPMQAKAPAPPGPGQYPSWPHPPLTSYSAPPGPPSLIRPPLGTPPSHTPPQSASPSPGPRMPPAQATPPPAAVSSSSYYSKPQQPQPMAPAWQYNTAPPPMGPPTSIGTPPRGNNVNPSLRSTAPLPPSSAAYSSAPPANVSHSATQPSGPGMPPTSAHGFTQQGKNTKAHTPSSCLKSFHFTNK